MVFRVVLEAYNPGAVYMDITSFIAATIEYYGDNQYNWNNGPFDVYLNTLKNIEQMETEAEKSRQ